MPASGYASNVFINCPFDAAYEPIFDALIFAVFDCGFVPRCALEIDDSSQVRIDKIFRIIEDCKFSIHDISRTEPDPSTNLPRFNMPLELGVFLGAKRFGGGRHGSKSCLILDSERYRYQAFVSDIAGQDIKAHDGSPEKAIRRVRDWLRGASNRSTIPGGRAISRRYQLFRTDLPALCNAIKLEAEELTFNDKAVLVSSWLEQSG